MGNTTYWHPLREVVSINVDLLFENFEVADVEPREDLTVNSYAVKLYPCYSEEWEEAEEFDTPTCNYKDMK